MCGGRRGVLYEGMGRMGVEVREMEGKARVRGRDFKKI